MIKTETPVPPAPTDELLISSIAKIDRAAFGIAIGSVFGAVIFFATNFLIFKGGSQIGPTLALLNQYFFGYSVTFTGSLIGLFYGFVSGFFLGWFTAFLRNFIIAIYLYVAKFKGRMIAVNNFIDYP